MSAVQEHSKRHICYFYDPSFGNIDYGNNHPMKPSRIEMTNQLVVNYKLDKHMEVYQPLLATYEELTEFHDPCYINILTSNKRKTPTMLAEMREKYNLGSKDCPFFVGLDKFCQLSSGGSLAAASKLNKQKTDIAINWMGGLHHAKKDEAYGFCYSNDIVLAILKLLESHQRVLYVDIDVHHGDGVEEAFCTNDRVMTVSFHKHGDGFFPRTGDVSEVGVNRGKYYAVNVPLRDGITDEAYKSIFEPVMTRVMERFKPEAVILQCGADSLAGDALGSFNLTLHGHGSCVTFFLKRNIPLMLLGGGGYTVKNVARCWTYETSLAVNEPVSTLHIERSNITNENTKEMLNNIQMTVYENLCQVPSCPSVQMQPIPSDAFNVEEMEQCKLDAANPDERLTQIITDKMIEHPSELYDTEKEGGDVRNEESFKPDNSFTESDIAGNSDSERSGIIKPLSSSLYSNERKAKKRPIPVITIYDTDDENEELSPAVKRDKIEALKPTIGDETSTSDQDDIEIVDELHDLNVAQVSNACNSTIVGGEVHINENLVQDTIKEQSLVDAGTSAKRFNAQTVSVAEDDKNSYEIIKAANFKLEQTSKGTQRLTVFASNDKTTCCVFYWNKKDYNYHCRGCFNTAQRKTVSAKLLKDENGEYVQIRHQHVCVPVKYIPPLSPAQLESIKAPNFFVHDVDRRIVVFNSDDRNYYYHYSKKRKSYNCLGCLNGHVKYVSAKIIKDKNHDECLLAKKNHFCDPLTYKISDGFDVLKSPSFALIQGESNGSTSMLRVYTSNARLTCYNFTQMGSSYACSGCLSKSNHFMAKLFKDKNDEEVVYVWKKQKHVCRPIIC